MKIRSALGSFVAITLLYLAIIVGIDAKNYSLEQAHALIAVVPTLVALSFASYLVRYARWHWLLGRAGYNNRPARGFLHYLAGFAFGATPGKIGELVRIRYLGPQGIPASRVVSAFVYERAFDLLVVLLISMLAITDATMFTIAALFVLSLIVAILFLSHFPGGLTRVAVHTRALKLSGLSRILVVLRDGLTGIHIWLNPRDTVVSSLLGLVAWSLSSLAFIILIKHFGIAIPLASAFAIYPLAMLAGAASMVPGGLGSTELAIVVLLSLHDVPVDIAALVAVGIRLSSLWFAIFCGLVCIGILEAPRYRRKRV